MKNQVLEMLKLAQEKNLSIKTDSIARDQKHKQLVITEEISEINAEGVVTRSGIFYSITDDVDNSLVNAKIMEAKAQAIASYCGLEYGTSSKVEPVVDDAPADEPEIEAPEETEEDVVEKPAKKTRKKKAPAKAAKKKSAKAPVETEETEDDADDLLGDADEGPEVDTDEETIPYDHKDKEHNSFLRQVVIKTYGKDWKKDKGATSAVKKAIAKLDGKVPVTSADGDLLPSFNKKCKALLAS